MTEILVVFGVVFSWFTVYYQLFEDDDEEDIDNDEDC